MVTADRFVMSYGTDVKMVLLRQLPLYVPMVASCLGAVWTGVAPDADVGLLMTSGCIRSAVCTSSP